MNAFTEQYYMDGIKSGVSNYENYSYRPDQTISMATHLKRYLRIKDGDSTLEVGAARGFYVKALRDLGVNAYGQDISEWAISNCHPDVKPYMSNYMNGAEYDVVWSKDCLEHVPPMELMPLVVKMLRAARRKVFIIVPLARVSGGEYVHPKEEKDSTHINRWTLHDWLVFFQSISSSFIVNGSYRYPGLKPGCYEVECGYGFFTLERI